MPKIKIIITDGYYDYDDTWHSKIVEGISDWEEVSEDDYQFIKNNLHHLNIKNGNPIIIRQDTISVYERIEGIKKTLLKREEEYKKRAAEEKRKRAEAAEKRRAKKLAKDTDALQRLAKENPELFKELAVAINT